MHKRRLFNVILCAAGLLLLLGAAVRDAEAQSAVVTGKVVGRGGDALGGAIVVIDQLSLAAATTVAGAYTMTVPPQWTKGQTVTLRARSIGYSPATKQVTLTPGNQAPAVSALGSLEGKVAGVRLLTGSGGPGGEPNIRLRSATALTSPAACNSPPCGCTEV